MTPVHEAVLDVLDGGGALFFRAIADRVAASRAEQTARRSLRTTATSPARSGTWSGRAGSPTTRLRRCVPCLVPAGRSRLAATAASAALAGRPGAAISRRPGFGRGAMPSQHRARRRSAAGGRPCRRAEPDPTRRLHAQALALLERYGILIRGAAAAERVTGGFGALYPVLRALEDAGQCRRGYFVEGLGAAQFALPGAVDRMRAMADSARAAQLG